MKKRSMPLQDFFIFIVSFSLRNSSFRVHTRGVNDSSNIYILTGIDFEHGGFN